jgi:hypothetical protein
VPTPVEGVSMSNPLYVAIDTPLLDDAIDLLRKADQERMSAA